jgi:hypothetical protein
MFTEKINARISRIDRFILWFIVYKYSRNFVNLYWSNGVKLNAPEGQKLGRSKMIGGCIARKRKAILNIKNYLR